MQIRSSSSELTVLPYPAKMVSLPQEEVTNFAAAAGQTYPAKPYQIWPGSKKGTFEQDRSI